MTEVTRVASHPLEPPRKEEIPNATPLLQTAELIHKLTHQNPKPPSPITTPEEKLYAHVTISPEDLTNQPTGAQLLGFTTLFKLPFQAIQQYMNYNKAKRTGDTKGKLDAGVRILSLSIAPFHAVFYFATLSYTITSKVFNAIKDVMPPVFVFLAQIFAKVLMPLTILACVFETAYAAISLKRIYKFSKAIPHHLWHDLKQAVATGNVKVFKAKFERKKTDYEKLLGPVFFNQVKDHLEQAELKSTNGDLESVKIALASAYEIVLQQMFHKIDGKFFNLNEERSRKIAHDARLEAAHTAIDTHIENVANQKAKKQITPLVDEAKILTGKFSHLDCKAGLTKVKDAVENIAPGVPDTLQQDYKRILDNSDALRGVLTNFIIGCIDCFSHESGFAKRFMDELNDEGWDGSLSYKDHQQLFFACKAFINKQTDPNIRLTLNKIYQDALAGYTLQFQDEVKKAYDTAINRHLVKTTKMLRLQQYASLKETLKLPEISITSSEKEIRNKLSDFAKGTDNDLLDNYDREKEKIYADLIGKKVIRSYASFSNLVGKDVYRSFYDVAKTYHETGQMPRVTKLETSLSEIKTQTSKKMLMHFLALTAIALTITSTLCSGIGAPAIVGLVLLGISLTLTGINYSFESSILPSPGWSFDINKMLPEPFKKLLASIVYLVLQGVSYSLQILYWIGNPSYKIQSEPLYLPDWVKERVLIDEHDAPLVSFRSRTLNLSDLLAQADA